MMMQISELVKAQGGLVLSRKETKASGNGGCPYKRLTLRALTEDGEIDSSALEDFCTSETLSHAWFASPGDVVIRLFSPLCPVVIEEGQEKLLVPSQLAILKVKDYTILLPEFLKISLSQKEIQEKIRRFDSNGRRGGGGTWRRTGNDREDDVIFTGRRAGPDPDGRNRKD